MRRASSLLSALAMGALVVLLVVAPGCGKPPNVSFEITIPNDVVDTTVWFEIGAYENASCASLTPMLLNGVPNTANKRVAFRRDDPAAPTIGDLDKGTYAFAAVAKADDCSVLATGCTEVNVDKSNSIEIDLADNDPPTGACETGASCQAAVCVPADDNSDPSVGAGCSLELLGAGPLPNPIGGEGTMLSAPSIAATTAGFVIAYKEINPDGEGSVITFQPVDTAGGALDPTRPQLSGRCSNSMETDGAGLLVNADGSGGQLVLARSACGAQPGLELYAFTSTPEVNVNPTFQSSSSATSMSITLSDAHVLAATGANSIVAFIDDGIARVSTVIPGTGVTMPSGTIGGVSGMTGAWAASSDKVIAVLAAGPPGTVVPDAGADAGDAGDASTDGATPPPDPDPTTTSDSPQLSLVVVPTGTSAGSFDATSGTPIPPITFDGSWAAVAALGTRVIVLSDGSGPGRSVSYRTFDLNNPQAIVNDGFSVDGTGTVTTGDVTMQSDNVFFGVLKPGGVSLHVFAGASTTPRLLRDVTFSSVPRIPSVSNVRDGRVAVAATSSRVAVVWTTARTLTSNDGSGGYAVFACTP